MQKCDHSYKPANDRLPNPRGARGSAHCPLPQTAWPPLSGVIVWAMDSCYGSFDRHGTRGGTRAHVPGPVPFAQQWFPGPSNDMRNAGRQCNAADFRAMRRRPCAPKLGTRRLNDTAAAREPERPNREGAANDGHHPQRRIGLYVADPGCES